MSQIINIINSRNCGEQTRNRTEHGGRKNMTPENVEQILLEGIPEQSQEVFSAKRAEPRKQPLCALVFTSMSRGCVGVVTIPRNPEFRPEK